VFLSLWERAYVVKESMIYLTTFSGPLPKGEGVFQQPSRTAYGPIVALGIREENYEDNIVVTIGVIAAGACHSNPRCRPKHSQTSDDNRTHEESRGKARRWIESPRDDHTQRWSESKRLCLQRRR